MKLRNITRNKILLENLVIAETFFNRLKGLLGKKGINGNEGLLIKDCNQIHMFFMKFPIDAVFLKSARRPSGSSASPVKEIYKVVKIIRNIKPWRFSPYVFRADTVLEMKSQKTSATVAVGDELEVI